MNDLNPYQRVPGWILLLLSVPLLLWVAGPGGEINFHPHTFLFWHTVFELIAVVVAMLVFITAFRALMASHDGVVILLGVAFFGVGILDFLHAMSYAGLPGLGSPNTPQKAMFFWLAARTLAGLALLAYVLAPALPVIGDRGRRLALLAMAAVVGVIGLAGLCWPDRMPTLYVAGDGMTPLKIGLEWLIVTINLACLVVLWRRRASMQHEQMMALGFAAALSAVSELFFTLLGVVVTDTANLLGHLYRAAAYLYLFHATFNEALRRPLQKIALQHLREKLILSSAPDGVLWLDQEGEILMANPAMETLTGYSAAELVGQNILLLLLPDERNVRSQLYASFVAAYRGDMTTVELALVRRDGTTVPAEIFLAKWRENEAPRVIAYVRNLSERTQALKRIQESTQRLALHFQLTPLAVIEWDTDLRAIAWNRAAEAIFGYPSADAIGRHATELLPPIGNGTHAAHAWDRILNDPANSRTTSASRTRDGRIIYCNWYHTRLVDADGKMIGVASLAQDATEQRRASERISHLAYYDDLTGLPNRTLFKERLQGACDSVDSPAQEFAVISLDIDRFKDVNESLGHAAGDLLLKASAQKLLACFGVDDTVARFGGDEFGVIVTGARHMEDVTRLAQQVVETFRAPMQVAGSELYVTFSMGIARYPVDGRNVETILRNVASAMHSAKALGRNCYLFYSAVMTERAAQNLALQTGLRGALAKRELMLHYQPQLECASGRVVGVEALLRWNHPTAGMISPAQFIPVAEDTGLIVPIGEWVLRTACEQARAWQRGGTPVRVAVNLSARQLKEPKFPQRVIEILQQTGLDPQYLELEITESALVDDLGSVNGVLQGFKRAGIVISLDDFGTGYSSLSYLKRFPIDKLKIDQSFVRDVLNNDDDAGLVRAVIAMARALRLTVIAEGVETQGQCDFLRADGCNEIQGYLVARPMAAEAVPSFVRRHDGSAHTEQDLVALSSPSV